MIVCCVFQTVFSNKNAEPQLTCLPSIRRKIVRELLKNLKTIRSVLRTFPLCGYHKTIWVICDYLREYFDQLLSLLWGSFIKHIRRRFLFLFSGPHGRMKQHNYDSRFFDPNQFVHENVWLSDESQFDPRTKIWSKDPLECPSGTSSNNYRSLHLSNQRLLTFDDAVFN